MPDSFLSSPNGLISRTTSELDAALRSAIAHPSVLAVAHGLDLTIRMGIIGEATDPQSAAIDICIRNGDVALEHVCRDTPVIIILAEQDAWAKALAVVPPPLFQSFSAWQLRNPEFSITGEPLAIAQSRAFLECLIERWHVSASRADPKNPSLENITGRYHRVTGPHGRSTDIFVETSGEGLPLLCLHTAGADARQYHGVMSGLATYKRYKVISFDMPAHGRSMPTDDWDGEDYKLDQSSYVAWCVAVIEQVIGQAVMLLGCSMGAAIALVIAAERPDLVKAVFALEAPVRPRGRRNDFLTHGQVNAGWHTSAYVRGLMSPLSPLEHRRRAAWIYAQGGPGVYDGDLRFYSDEFDGENIAKAIDGRRTPVVLMTGHYDFSATVADAKVLSGWIAHSRVVEMPELGHFPMTENPVALLGYLLPELDRLDKIVTTQNEEINV